MGCLPQFLEFPWADAKLLQESKAKAEGQFPARHVLVLWWRVRLRVSSAHGYLSGGL
jgi:hypothetical protein